MILAIRTDQPEAEIYLFQGTQEIDVLTWHAHRALSITIHQQIEALLNRNGGAYELLTGIVFFAGPGSFTGLRIGCSVVNALGSGLAIPVVASSGENWLYEGVTDISQLNIYTPIEPVYGSAPRITPQKDSAKI